MALQKTDFIWVNGKFVEWDNAYTHLLTHTLHYGGGAFEGIRFYKTDRGPAIFRLREHIERLLFSISKLKMEVQYSVDDLVEATREVVSRNKVEQGYIRPLIYYGYGIMGLRPVGAPVETMIACWPWGSYLPHDMVDVKVSSFIRIHRHSTFVEAKLCGHYVNSMLATIELRGTDFHEALLLDADGKVAEGPGENIFIVSGGVLKTPQPGTILPGITRDTTMQIARQMGVEVKECILSVDDVKNADEAFFTGTAAEITPIRSLDHKILGTGTVGPITAQIKDTYHQIVLGKRNDYGRFLTYAAA